MLSKTGQYALSAAVALARTHRRDPGRRLRAAEIIEELGVPENYLTKILGGLVRAGILESSRGPAGGFRLAVGPERLTLSEVIAPFDDRSRPLGCLLRGGPCDLDAPCVAHDRWTTLATSIHAFFAETTVGELLEGATPPTLD